MAVLKEGGEAAARQAARGMRDQVEVELKVYPFNPQ
jgi:hypothetical protein